MKLFLIPQLFILLFFLAPNISSASEISLIDSLKLFSDYGIQGEARKGSGFIPAGQTGTCELELVNIDPNTEVITVKYRLNFGLFSSVRGNKDFQVTNIREPGNYGEFGIETEAADGWKFGFSRFAPKASSHNWGDGGYHASVHRPDGRHYNCFDFNSSSSDLIIK